MNKTTSSLLLIALISSSSTILSHDASPAGNVVESPNIMNWIPTTKTAAALTALVLSFGRLYSKEPSPNFEQRGSFKNLLDYKQLLKDPKKYAGNVRDLLDDYWVGQKYKPKSIRLGDSDEKLTVRKKDCPPVGVCGNVDAYVLQVGKKTFEGVAGLVTMYNLYNSGIIQAINHNLGNKITPKISQS